KGGMPALPPYAALRRFSEDVVRPPRTAAGREPPLSFPPPIYSAAEAFMKPWVVPHNRRPKRQNQRNGRSKTPVMTGHAVVIAGGGPTGLMLAGELALAGVDVAIVERRASQDLAGSRAGGLHSRTIEVLDQRGIADRFVSQGQKTPVVRFHIPLDISDSATRHNYTLALWQNQIERI